MRTQDVSLEIREHPSFFFTHRQTRTYCGKLVKLPEEFVQQFDQLLSCALRSQTGEPNNVCKKDTKGEENAECWLSKFTCVIQMGDKLEDGNWAELIATFFQIVGHLKKLIRFSA